MLTVQFLIINVRSSNELVFDESRQTLSDELSLFQVGVDADFVDEFHLINIEKQQVVGLRQILLLEDHWDEVDVVFHVEAILKRKLDLVILDFLLILNQILVSHPLIWVECEPLEHVSWLSNHVVANNHGDFLVILDERLVVIQSEFLNLCDGFLNEEVIMLAVESISDVGQGENEDIVPLVSVVDFGSDDLVWAHVVIGLVSDIVVSSIFAFDNPERLLLILLKSVAKVFLFHWNILQVDFVIEFVNQEGLNMSLTRDDVSILGINIVGIVVFLDLLLPLEESFHSSADRHSHGQ